jgi:hypothetical protein
MEFNRANTTERYAAPHNPHESIPVLNLGGPSRGFAIGHLDRRDSDSHVEFPAEGRTLWVSLINPRSLLGPLLDEMAFEGAWLETDGLARIRLRGHGERRVTTPLFHSPESARLWLATELLETASDPACLKPQDSSDAGTENLAA